MRAVVLCALLGVVPGLPARADFHLQATPSTGPLVDQLMPDQRPTALPIVRPPRGKPIAEGFGHAIPLSSALRQILPEGVPSRLDDSVDAASPVDWTGGQPWDVVLRKAVAPLGVTVRINSDGVLLTR